MSAATTGGGGDNLQRPLGDGIVPEEMVTKTEKRWLWIVVTVLTVIIAVIVVTRAMDGLHPPSSAETIDPAKVYHSREFSETNLGTAIEPDGGATVRMIAQQYSFVPRCVTVPVGIPVTFRLTSADVIHGFLIADTNINTMVVPGYLSNVKGTFPATGTYKMACHEFCGIGHAGMSAEVRVVPASEMPRLGTLERTRCAAK
jgi:cytochrome c oxidase subunit 2